MLLLYQNENLERVFDFFIYIPLCFYFIMCMRYDKEVSIIFTFHYASTLSRDLGGFNRINLSFTFHYASTLSMTHQFRSLPQIHLHSTMLLLYPYSLKWQAWPWRIYIPLCFYFILMRLQVTTSPLWNLHSTMLLLYPTDKHWWTGERLFTFHYASTLSVCRWDGGEWV